MASLSYSQSPLLEKTQYKGNNAFVGNEIVMDSIFNKYKSYEFLLIKYDSLSITHGLTLISLEKAQLGNIFYEKLSTDLKLSIQTIQQRIDNQNNKHDTEILYYKEKAKGKKKAFLYGVGVGGLIIAILTII